MAAAKKTEPGQSRFKGLSTAKTFERGAYLEPGDYLLEITKCFVKETRKKGDAFIAEFDVLESSCEKIKVGSSRNWFQSLSDKDIGFGAMKEFFAATLGVDLKDPEQLEELESEIEEIAEAAVAKNGLAGKRVRVTCHMKKTKEKGMDFTVHTWKSAE